MCDGAPVASGLPPLSDPSEYRVEPSVQLRPNVPYALGENVTVLDVSTAVEALKNKPDGFAGAFGPCTDACPGEAVWPIERSVSRRLSAVAW